MIYIEKLANGDRVFLLDFIAILRNEFPEERTRYQHCLGSGDLDGAAQWVHKIKHKFGILGLSGAYTRAVSFENELQHGNSMSKVRFENDLEQVETYLNTI